MRQFHLKLILQCFVGKTLGSPAIDEDIEQSNKEPIFPEEHR